MSKELRINEEIRVPQVRVIREDEQLGIMATMDALRLAEQANLDLVEIAPTANPPVVKIMDYGKFKYEQSKRDRESRRGSKQVELREVRMKVKIDRHDRDFKIRIARKLLLEGDKVKVSVMFRAREITHPEVAEALLKDFYEQVQDVADQEKPPRLEGRFMNMILDPSKKLAAAARKSAKQPDTGAKEETPAVTAE
ncbi:MAG: translation initiation factor IF-3 [Chloroflexi bacterium HGW-Chloroflexi-9]|nr:MAG: translation initiation factor IF-3 [Chloroflexi bacterium HGW-Chloroflexi-9]